MRDAFRFPASLVALSILLAGCSDAPIAGPDRHLDAGLHVAAPAPPAVGVLNWNIYVGADADAVIAALVTPDPADDVPAILGALETFERTFFPARAEAIADAIGRHRPLVVALQEVSSIDVDLNPFGVPAVVHLDFLAILQDALARRGLDYVVGGEVTNIVATPLPSVSLVDRDVLLVDAPRVTVTSSAGQSYTANIGEVAPGVELKRGWVMITADVNGRSFTFVNTHLESGQGDDLSALRAAQALELMSIVGAAHPRCP